MSLNPGTPVSALKPVLDDIDLVLVMSVNPGFAGQQFITSQLEKIKEVRRLIGARAIELEVDGGIKPDNVRAVAAAGADVVVAGSAVFAGNDYVKTIEALRAAAV